MAEDFSADGMLDMYLYENGQLIEQLEATTLEKKDADSFDEADINEFFRVMHTIKGSSGIMMFDDIMKLAHKLEDEQPYDLICLDVMMPVMDGYQVLNTIRNMEKQRGIEGDDRVKIIMMTALNEQKNVRKAFEMGCTVYCAKPVDLDKLKNVLKKLKLI